VADVGNFALGVLASLAAWRLIILLLSPRFTLTTQIARRPDTTNYMIKVQNRHWKTHLADLQIAARVDIVGLRDDRADRSVLGRVPLSSATGTFPMLRARKGGIWRLELERVSFTSSTQQSLDPSIQESVERGTVALEDLLNLGRDAFVTVAFSAANAKSGVRRSVLREYRKRDIKLGDFKPGSTSVHQQ
jgi:hypothetical protein